MAANFKTPHDSTGTTVSFTPTAGVASNLTVTNLQYSLSSQSSSDELDVSHLGLVAGAQVLTQSRPLQGQSNGETGREIQVDYVGDEVFEDDTEGTLTLGGGLNWTGSAKVTSSSLTLAVNDVIRGSVTFRIERKAVT